MRTILAIPFAAPVPFLVTITDGKGTQHIRNYYQEKEIFFALPFFDNYSVRAKGYKQASFVPVTLSDRYLWLESKVHRRSRSADLPEYA